MKQTVTIVILLALVILGVSLFGSGNSRTDSKTKNTVLAPEHTLQDLNGNTVRILSDHQNKVRVVNTWASWCPFCVNELPDFVALQEEFDDKIVVIAVNRQESFETQQEYLAEAEIRNGLVYLLDPQDSFYKSIGGFSMPETIFVNERNEIVIHKRGPIDLNEMRELVKQTLDS